MKKALITIIGVAAMSVAKAQQQAPQSEQPAAIRIDTSSANNSKIFTAVEQAPQFAGGLDKFYKFLQSNIRYPAVAFENNVQGKVFISFVVEKDGTLTGIRVLHGIGAGCDEEAVRVMKISPKWNPGIQNGRPVRVQYSVPISFTLAGR